MSAVPNPVPITIPRGSQGDINCVANAAHHQRVTLTWPGQTVVFSGTGEGSPMTTGTGQESVLVPADADGFTISATFEYELAPGAGFQKARVQPPIETHNGPFTIFQVTSEDGSDDDRNDSYLTISLVGEAAVAAASDEPVSRPAEDVDLEVPTALGAVGAGLSTHAKTYYSGIEGGDEHLIDVPPFHSDTRKIQWTATGWTTVVATVYDQKTPLGGYLHLYGKLNECLHADMQDAELVITGVLSYWGGHPTGYRTVPWEGSMTGTTRKLTAVKP
jgi:hypothetical protein